MEPAYIEPFHKKLLRKMEAKRKKAEDAEKQK